MRRFALARCQASHRSAARASSGPRTHVCPPDLCRSVELLHQLAWAHDRRVESLELQEIRVPAHDRIRASLASESDQVVVLRVAADRRHRLRVRTRLRPRRDAGNVALRLVDRHVRAELLAPQHAEQLGEEIQQTTSAARPSATARRISAGVPSGVMSAETRTPPGSTTSRCNYAAGASRSARKGVKETRRRQAPAPRPERERSCAFRAQT